MSLRIDFLMQFNASRFLNAPDDFLSINSTPQIQHFNLLCFRSSVHQVIWIELWSQRVCQHVCVPTGEDPNSPQHVRSAADLHEGQSQVQGLRKCHRMEVSDCCIQGFGVSIPLDNHDFKYIAKYCVNW